MIRVYLPPDANTLLSVMDHCLRSRDYVNIVVAGKQPELQYLDMDSAVKHCTAGIGIWEWASTDRGEEPEVVMACAGDIPTLEILAAVELLRDEFPDLKIRVVNVVDLMRLLPREEHPHGLSDRDFDSLFTTRQAGRLRLPRLPVAHPPPDLPPHQPRQPPRPRLQGGGHDHHAVRHGRAATIWTATTWRSTSSTACRAWPLSAPTPNRAFRDRLIEHRQYIQRTRRRSTGDCQLALARAFEHRAQPVNAKLMLNMLVHSRSTHSTRSRRALSAIC